MQQSVMPERLRQTIIFLLSTLQSLKMHGSRLAVFFKGAGEAAPSVNIQSDLLTGPVVTKQKTLTLGIKTAIPLLRLMSQLSEVAIRTRQWHRGMQGDLFTLIKPKATEQC